MFNKSPFSRKVIMSVLAFVAAAGGYGGYSVMKDYGIYGSGFENKVHIVEEVVDGDTIIIENGIRVRLLGVDAPERSECFGKEAGIKLRGLVLGREVVLEKDQTASDNYGRLLRYVILRNGNPEVDDIFINKELVRGGYAKSAYVKPNRRYLSQLQAAEREAQGEGSGMWGVCDAVNKPANLEREQASVPSSKDCVIKGNINKRYEKDYFLPGCPNYKRVKIDERKGEKWFCTESEAKADGWEKSASCNNIWQTRE